MSRQARFMEVISNNIANAEVTRTAEGGAYKRQIAVAGTDANGNPTTTITQDKTPGQKFYEPGHEDADANGWVEYPNVDIATETVDLMIARRMHDANATVFQSAKEMLRRAIDI
jgi:flagellar basal-body rod protein FlgC